MRLPGIFAFVAAAAVESAALSVLAADLPGATVGLLGEAAGRQALALHGLAAGLFALGGTLITGKVAGGGAPLFTFFFVFALFLPVIGIAVGIPVSVLLLRRVRTDPYGGRFTVGNPLLEQAASPGIPDLPPAAPNPLTTTLRALGSSDLPRLILGLRQVLPHPGARALLRRFQRDPSSQVQFYAQSALGDEGGMLEDHLAILATRTTARPGDTANRAAVAEILVHLASRPDAGTADRLAQARQALEQLDAALAATPDAPSLLFLQARARLLRGETARAREILGRVETLNGAPHLVDELRLEILFLEGRWRALAGESARPLSPSHRAALGFWRTPSSS